MEVANNDWCRKLSEENIEAQKQKVPKQESLNKKQYSDAAGFCEMQRNEAKEGM